MRLQPLTLLLLLLNCLIVACGAEEPDKGQESALPALDGKTDSFRAPTEHGLLTFGVGVQGVFAEHAMFHAWDFVLSGPADLVLATNPADPALDTVLYLYRRDPGAASWGAYLARNDDDGDTLASRISGAFEPGEYRVLVKAHRESMRGPFDLVATCSGTGCPAPEPDAILTPEEAALALKAIDDICGDTFCAGDFDYRMVGLECGTAGVCVFTFDARNVDETTFTADMLDGAPADRLVTSGATTDGEGRWTAALLEVLPEPEHVWVRGNCTLDGAFLQPADVITPTSYGAELHDRFYEHVIDCISGVEQLLWAAAP